VLPLLPGSGLPVFRLEKSCLYTSTSFFIWLRFQRRVRMAFVVLPLVLGSLATWKVLTDTDLAGLRFLVSLAAFLAGLLPGIYAALKFDDHLAGAASKAAEFKNLQDRF